MYVFECLSDDDSESWMVFEQNDSDTHIQYMVLFFGVVHQFLEHEDFHERQHYNNIHLPWLKRKRQDKNESNENNKNKYTMIEPEKQEKNSVSTEKNVCSFFSSQDCEHSEERKENTHREREKT